jgi:2-dehydropantoate 2-reductase
MREGGDRMGKIAIIGGGSLGLLWSARLATSEIPFTLITRTVKQAHLLNGMGLTWKKLSGETARLPLTAVAIEQMEPELYDLLFVMVKQPQLSETIPVLQKMTHPSSQILFWQNGIGHEELLAQLSERPYTYAAITTEGARRLSPVEVQHTGGGETWIGTFPHARPVDQQLTEQLALLNKKTKCKLVVDTHIMRRMWEKVVINCAINPLTAIHCVPNGELLQSTYTPVIEEVCREVCLVAEQKGITMDVEAIIERVKQVCRKTAINHSSMLQDIQNGKKTEIAYLNGAIVRYGQAYGLSTPRNEQLTQQVLLLEQKTASNIS